MWERQKVKIDRATKTRKRTRCRLPDSSSQRMRALPLYVPDQFLFNAFCSSTSPASAVHQALSVTSGRSAWVHQLFCQSLKWRRSTTCFTMPRPPVPSAPCIRQQQEVLLQRRCCCRRYAVVVIPDRRRQPGFLAVLPSSPIGDNYSFYLRGQLDT